MATKRGVFWKALIASFSVYLLPLVTVHVVLVWGWAVWAEFVEDRGGREAPWLAADAALALGIQAAAFGVFFWIFSGRGWRWLALAAAVPAFAAFLNTAYLWVLPQYFLIEAETAPETGDWTLACRVEDATLLPVRQPATPDLARRGEAWVLSPAASATWRRLTGPDCALEAPAYAPPAVGGSLVAVAAGGAALYAASGGDPPGTRYWHLDPESGAATPLDPPPDARTWLPALARDGRAVGWLERDRVDGATRYRLRTREVATGRERAVLLDGLDGIGPRILALDGFEGAAILAQYPAEVLTFDAAGARVGEAIRPEGIEHIGDGFVRLEGGWVAWETYREKGRVRLVWDLPAGAGRREIPLGSGITDLAVSPGGALVAVSTTSNLNIGDTEDSVFVLRTRDGGEVFRRYHRKYTRTQLAFLGARHLAMTRFDRATGEAWVEVLEVPQDAAAP